MLLRTRIIFALITALVIIACIMLVQNYVSREQIQKAIVSEVTLGQNVIWKKIVDASHKQMEFYAYDSRPGMPSIWALRGKRSAIAAIEKKNPRLIDRSIKKFFTGLYDKRIIDHIFIFEQNGEFVHNMSTENIKAFNLSEISKETFNGKTFKNTILGLSIINDQLCSIVIFKIFSNGRPIGSILYGKKITPLIDSFVDGAQADVVALLKTKPIFTEKYISFKDFESNFETTKDFIKANNKYFSLNESNLNLLNGEIIPIFFIRDITPAINEYNRIFLIAGLLILSALLLIGVIIIFILRAGFKPLYGAINALKSLSNGNTNVDVNVSSNDEVGQIATAVKSFKEALINYGNIRSNTLKNRQEQEEKIINETLKLASLLPVEQRKELRQDVNAMKKLNKENMSDEENLFNTQENQTINLLTIAFSRISKEIKALFRKQVQLTEAYQRFVPEQLLKSLEKRSILEVNLGDQVQKNMTVLFSDIRAFTNISEKLEPAENFKFVNDYLAGVVPSIRKHNGYVDKYIGDAIMALFTEEGSDAVKSAIDMLTKLDKLNKIRNKEKKPTISIGIGINTGSVMLGMLGVADRLEGSVISDTVNVAARLEELTKFYKVPLLIGGDTERSLHNNAIARREIDYIEVKGKENKISIYEVYQWEAKEIIFKKDSLKTLFSEGLKHYRAGHYRKCLDVLKKYKKELPNDKVIDLYIGRCNNHINKI